MKARGFGKSERVGHSFIRDRVAAGGYSGYDECGESTIRQWVMASQAEGLSGLRSKWHGKNANHLTEEQRASSLSSVSSRIVQWISTLSAGEYWTVSDLRIAVKQHWLISKLSWKKVTDFLQDYPDRQIIALDEMSLYVQTTTFQTHMRIA